MSRLASDDELQRDLDNARLLLDEARTRFDTAEHRKHNGELPPELAAALVAGERIGMLAAEIRLELLEQEFKRRQRSMTLVSLMVPVNPATRADNNLGDRRPRAIEPIMRQVSR